ncbi:hypothetical protein PHYSODRAFT_305278 [Phytophthora sojae]|uniref:MULE transposase domain-containing protein n=1 Tax=Phytophthora sojae (strain P6497) TaxID=1094619 RepID=G5A2M5_PHYSP|nr:hypothetical protein PHYSODRAFT_305278 [Phytophthora sojae]EGZ09915.1 hypothetical protein PHYSODRAFT_305278 [Phytophthora sojae]|eukprot:XP_009534776.1 hypothetical protein PHYSODRAFT_305278 [Phytophthora sojae]
MDGRQATLYRAIRKRLMQTKIMDDYSLLPDFFTAFESMNPGSRRIHSLLLPVLQTDGTHMKSDNYNGICLTMIGLGGDRKVVPLETNENFSWFFANCIASGISMANLPLFSDRGKHRDAQKHLASLGYQVN